MWFIGVEVEQETSAPPPKKNPGSWILMQEARTRNLEDTTAFVVNGLKLFFP